MKKWRSWEWKTGLRYGARHSQSWYSPPSTAVLELGKGEGCARLFWNVASEHSLWRNGWLQETSAWWGLRPVVFWLSAPNSIVPTGWSEDSEARKLSCSGKAVEEHLRTNQYNHQDPDSIGIIWKELAQIFISSPLLYPKTNKTQPTDKRSC